MRAFGNKKWPIMFIWFTLHNFFVRECNRTEEHWDTCQDAGPAKRVAAAFDEAQPSLKVVARNGAKLQWLALAVT